MPSPATHLRAPLLWLLLPLIAGLTAARLWPPPAAGLRSLILIAGAAGLVAGWAATRSGRLAFGLWGTGLSLAGALSGFVMLHQRLPLRPAEENRPPREIAVTVRIRQLYPAAPGARSLNGLGEIEIAGEYDRALVGCRIYFSAIRKVSLAPGRSGRYLLRGVIAPLPQVPAEGSFDDYLKNLGIRFKLSRAQIVRAVTPPGWFWRFCSRAEGRLEAILRHGLAGHPTVDSLYVAMLLGEKAELSADQQNAFMRSGTFHIFSVSGLHVGVIALALHSIFSVLPLPRRPAMAFSLLVLWLYVQVTGGSAPAMRAFIMIGFLLASQVFRLPGNPLAALTASALVTLFLDPPQLFTAGFQMSYSVVLALIVMGGPLAERWQAVWRPFALLPKPDWRWHHHFINWLGRKLAGACAGCWAAFLASIPSGIGYFQLFSPGSLGANLIIIPLSSLAIIGGFLSLLSGLVGLLSLSALFNSAAAITILVMDWLVTHSTGWPAFYFTGQFTHSWMTPVSLSALVVVLLAGAAGRWSRRYGGYWPPVVLIALLLLCFVRFGPDTSGGRTGRRTSAADPRPQNLRVFPAHPVNSTAMKSSYELAMERLAKSEPAARPMTAEKKGRLAEIDRVYQGKAAEREIFLKQQLNGALSAQNFDEADKIRKQIASEKARLEEEREAEKEKIRQST